MISIAALIPRPRRRGAITLQQALDDYLAARKDLRPKSAHVSPCCGALSGAVGRPAPAQHHPRDGGSPTPRHRRRGRSRRPLPGTGDGEHRNGDPAHPLELCRRPCPSLPANPVRRLRRASYPYTGGSGMCARTRMPAFHIAVMELPNAIQRDFLRLLLFTGLRLGEASSLTWNDVDFGARALAGTEQRTKAGRRLDLPLTDYVHDLLVARRAIGRERDHLPAMAPAVTLVTCSLRSAAWRRARRQHFTACELPHRRREYRTWPVRAQGVGEPQQHRCHGRIRADERRATAGAGAAGVRQAEETLWHPTSGGRHGAATQAIVASEQKSLVFAYRCGIIFRSDPSIHARSQQSGRDGNSCSVDEHHGCR